MNLWVFLTWREAGLTRLYLTVDKCLNWIRIEWFESVGFLVIFE